MNGLGLQLLDPESGFIEMLLGEGEAWAAAGNTTAAGFGAQG